MKDASASMLLAPAADFCPNNTPGSFSTPSTTKKSISSFPSISNQTRLSLYSDLIKNDSLPFDMCVSMSIKYQIFLIFFFFWPR